MLSFALGGLIITRSPPIVLLSLIVPACGLNTYGADDGAAVTVSTGNGSITQVTQTASISETATVPTSDGSTTQGTQAQSMSDVDPDTGSVASMAGSSSTGLVTATEAGTTDSGPVCGNGQIEAGEVCDDGNTEGGDECSADCSAVTCGDAGKVDLPYIWIANSQQNTISKIDTQTLVEKGRYFVRPDGGGSPSRTSVNLSGDVVTASRNGGFTKFYAQIEDCKESNGIPGIQTSVGADVLPWNQEECRAWHTPMVYASQRPVAWTQGTFNNAACTYENQKVWTSGNNMQNGTVDVLLVNGDTGAIESNVKVSGINADFYGIYGAAVDKDGNFWGSQLSQGYLVNVNRETLQYKTWPMAAPGYGMTVDSKGYVWTCSSTVARFDPMTEQWQTNNVGGSGGCMEDGKGTLYMSGGNNNIVAVDTETLQVKAQYPVPLYVHGISIDFNGYVWGVTMGSEAYRLDINQGGTFQTVSGLVGAYTYSDMTGFALSNVSQ